MFFTNFKIYLYWLNIKNKNKIPLIKNEIRLFLGNIKGVNFM